MKQKLKDAPESRYQDKDIRKYKKIMRNVETDWLDIIGVSSISEEVRTVITIQFLLSLPKDTARSYIDIINEGLCYTLAACEQDNLEPRHFKEALKIPVTTVVKNSELLQSVSKLASELELQLIDSQIKNIFEKYEG